MTFDSTVAEAQKFFPVQIKYKNEETLMKFLGKLLFFNPSFMTDYITTVGYTVYYPSKDWITQNEASATSTLIHECVHMHDEKTISPFLFQVGYLFPLWLSLLVPFLLFVLSWKIVLPLALFFLLPLPAPFRMLFEKKAYYVSTYVDYKLFNADPVADGAYWADQFTGGAYYWVWIFGLKKEFAQVAALIKQGQPIPVDAATMSMVEALITAAK